MVHRETFLQIQRLPLQLLILKNWIHGGKSLRSRFICLQRRKVKDQNKIDIWDASLDRQPKIKSSSVEKPSKNYGADQQRLQISDLHFDKFPTPANFACWKIRFKAEVCTCSQILTEAIAMDKRSGIGWFSGWIKIFVIYSWYFNGDFWSTWCEDCFGTEQNHPQFPIQKGESVWRNKRPRKRTVSFAVDRLPTWSTITFGSLGPMILSKTIPTCSLLFFEMTIFRNSILSGTEFYCPWRKSRLMTSWKDCTN